MKQIKKAMVTLMALVMCCGSVACGETGTGNGAADKTQVYIRYSDYGYGSAWITPLKQRFETFYQDYSFEEGKKGVEVIPDPTGNDIGDDMLRSRSWVYFIEYDFTNTKYYSRSQDLTNALTTSLGDAYGTDINGNPLPGLPNETKSVYDKMSTDEKSFYWLDEDKMIAAPYLDVYTGTLTYDVDLFEKYGLYYDATNELGAKKATGNLGLGPDGIQNTADDGLPRTYYEFFELCDKMVSTYGIVPFTWAGNFTNYISALAQSLILQNMGSEQYNTILKGEGVLYDYIDGEVGANGSYTSKQETITADEFDKMISTASVYEAVDFIKQIMQGNGSDLYYRGADNFSSSYTEESAQADFFWGKKRDKDIGFLVDGNWWYNEAEKYITFYENKYQTSRNNRNLAYMALPKANEDTWNRLKGENLVSSSYSSAIVVKKGLNPTQQMLAELFVRFACSNESLVEFHKIVSAPRGLSYTMTGIEYNALSPYAKVMYDVHTGNADRGYNTYKICNLRSATGIGKTNPEKLTVNYWLANTISNSNIVTTFYEHPEISSIAYYNAILKNYKLN